MSDQITTANPATGAHAMIDTHTTTHIPDGAVKAMPERIYAAKSDRPCIVCMDEKFRDYDVEYVRADIAAVHLSAPCAVEVNKLEWERTPAGNYKANSEFGTYTVIPDSWTESRKAHLKIDGIEKETEHSSIIEAKSAAQADFERRILSCVVTKPVDVAAVRRQALEEVIRVVDVFERDFDQKWRDQLKSEIRALSTEPAQGEQWQPTHRHVKRGTEYQRLGDAQVQCEDGLTDYELATVYVGSDGGLWVRRKSEFEDGRFVPLTAAPTTEAEQQ